MDRKIFISHAKADEMIGEKLLDTLVALGIPQDSVFYSSKYHTGVGLGKDFHNEVKAALESCEVVVFLLTPNFYASEYCLNEMGAAWYAEKKIIPILLGGLAPSDMRGFVDSHFIAFTPESEQVHMLADFLTPYIADTAAVKPDTESVFGEFVTAAEKLAEQVKAQNGSRGDTQSEAEKLILSGRLTDSEIILLNYFIESETPYLDDAKRYNYETGKWDYNDECYELIEYVAKFDRFDYTKPRHSLNKSGYLDYIYDGGGAYDGCELNIDLFRDLISVSPRGREYIDKVLGRRMNFISSRSSENVMDKIVQDPRLAETTALLIYYLLDTKVETLGDRWMADETKAAIKKWEDDNNIVNHKLSENYSTALWSLVVKDMVSATQYTSYGNPRQYKLKKEYDDGLFALSQKSRAVLEEVFGKNRVLAEDPPF